MDGHVELETYSEDRKELLEGNCLARTVMNVLAFEVAPIDDDLLKVLGYIDRHLSLYIPIKLKL